MDLIAKKKILKKFFPTSTIGAIRKQISGIRQTWMSHCMNTGKGLKDFVVVVPTLDYWPTANSVLLWKTIAKWYGNDRCC